MRPEEKVESYLRHRTKAAGGLCIKLAPTTAGVPDRMVLLPGGRIHLVELKAKDGRLRAVQRFWHRRAKDLGIKVEVLWSKQDVDDFFERLPNEDNPMIVVELPDLED